MLRKEMTNVNIAKTSIPIIQIPKAILVKGLVFRRNIDAYVNRWIKKNISKLAIT